MNTYEDSQKAIDAGGQALRASHRYPWYDRENDCLKRVEVRQAEGASFLHLAPDLDSLVFWSALGALTLVLAALVFMLLRATRLRKLSIRRGEPLAPGDAERIEALPYPLARASLSLLDQARNFYQAGNYAAAMIYLFSHQLVQLERRQIIRLAKGKTNRQYLREVGQAEALGQLFAQTLVAFEDVFFGHHEIDRQRFESCWSRLPEFESLLVRGPFSAA